MKHALVLLLCAACDGGPPMPDDQSPPDMTWVPAVNAPLPQIPNQGGPVLDHLHLVTVTFPGFTQQTQAEAFGDWVVTSSWLSTVGAEYGVGTGTHESVRMPMAATSTTGAGLVSFLGAQIANHTLPANTAKTLYIVYYPAELITDNHPTACSMYAGQYTPAYHNQSSVLSPFLYAVIPTCSELTLAALEKGSAHEIIEAATDPLPYGNPAYFFSSDDPWYNTGGEVADICNDEIVVDGHTVTRVWSNLAAASGHEPCIPSGAYFNTLPSPAAVTIAAGGSAMVTLTGWSSAEVPDWNLNTTPGTYSQLTITTSFDKTTLNNGGTAQLTLSVPSTAKSGDSGAVLVYSSTSIAHRYSWPIAVTVQ
jgi:hypothetical protein